MVSRSSASLPAAARLLMATRRVPVARAVLLLWSKIGLATPDIIGMAASSNFSETDNSPRIASPTWAALELADWLSNLRC
jgi:hypothetical protein